VQRAKKENMDIHNSTQIKGFFFKALRDQYKSRFSEREWDPFFLNYYNPFIERYSPFKVIFSWNFEGSGAKERLVARLEFRLHYGGDKLYKYLQENAQPPMPIEWVVRPDYGTPEDQRAFIMYEINRGVDIESLSINDFYRKNIIDDGVNAMLLMEKTFWHLVKRYFEEYIDK
jgi:hypothetical protein